MIEQRQLISGVLPLMSKAVPSFFFEHIPQNIDKSSINVFQHAKESFSLEYAIFDPKTVRINMYPVAGGWSRQKKVDRGIATIQHFSTALGLHPDFRQIHLDQQGELEEARNGYFKADKIFNSLTKEFPDMIFFYLWSEEPEYTHIEV